MCLCVGRQPSIRPENIWWPWKVVDNKNSENSLNGVDGVGEVRADTNVWQRGGHTHDKSLSVVNNEALCPKLGERRAGVSTEGG